MGINHLPNPDVDLSSCLGLLCAPKKLDREQGESILRSLTLYPDRLTFLCQWITNKIDESTGWEDIYGAVTAGTVLLQTLSDDHLNEFGLISLLDSRVLNCHENEEYRVRIAAGQLMGSICHRSGLPAFRHFISYVIDGITDNLERNLENPLTETESSMCELQLAQERDANLSRSSLSIFHDTAGWRHLETWVKCLQQMVVSISPEDFVQVERKTMLELIFKSVKHTNRFVRETGYDVLATVILGHGCYKDPSVSETSFVDVAKQLAVGLSDNWSQVRMAASRAARTYFEVPTPPEHTFEEIYPILLPPMCLNRYYVAEGVRIYSQDTWCRVTKGEGKRLLGLYLDAAIQYYIQQSDADNHAVREAACAAIAEVVSKLDPTLLRPHINTLLETLLTCFGDESWPVRDAACGALGTLVATFPAETKAAHHPDLFAKQFLRNLSDSIPSVRDMAASSITRVLSAASDAELNQLYCNHIRDKLVELREQATESHGVESQRVQGKNPGSSHIVVRSGEAAHDPRHTDQTMYSCGSLAPKLQKGRKGGGCHDGLHLRASEPWERADGAVRLVGQLAVCIPKLVADSMIGQITTAASFNRYTHYPYFLETVCRTIVLLCKGLEKARFKRHLDELLIVVAAAILSNFPLAVAAGEDALSTLNEYIGPNILRGRVENHMDWRVSRDLLQHLPLVM